MLCWSRALYVALLKTISFVPLGQVLIPGVCMQNREKAAAIMNNLEALTANRTVHDLKSILVVSRNR